MGATFPPPRRRCAHTVAASRDCGAACANIVIVQTGMPPYPSRHTTSSTSARAAVCPSDRKKQGRSRDQPGAGGECGLEVACSRRACDRVADQTCGAADEQEQSDEFGSYDVAQERRDIGVGREFCRDDHRSR
jgi:hypothetical protein